LGLTKTPGGNRKARSFKTMMENKKQTKELLCNPKKGKE